MADTKITALTECSDPQLTDIIPIVDDPSGTAATKKVTLTNIKTLVGGGTEWKYPADGRLTLESGVPLSASDQTAKTTVYYTPSIGDQLALYDGVSAWSILTFTELSIAVPATTDTVYDVFVYNNTGTPTLELTAWTNTTTRATALVRQNGVLVKSGATTRRYLGSFSTTGSSGQTEDSAQKRLVWNYYNRRRRFLYKTDGTSHGYNNGTIRAWNNDAAQFIQFVTGEICLFQGHLHLSLGANSFGDIAWGVDTYTAKSGQWAGMQVSGHYGHFESTYFANFTGSHKIYCVEAYIGAGTADAFEINATIEG